MGPTHLDNHWLELLTYGTPREFDPSKFDCLPYHRCDVCLTLK